MSVCLFCVKTLSENLYLVCLKIQMFTNQKLCYQCVRLDNLNNKLHYARAVE